MTVEPNNAKGELDIRMEMLDQLLHASYEAGAVQDDAHIAKLMQRIELEEVAPINSAQAVPSITTDRDRLTQVEVARSPSAWGSSFFRRGLASLAAMAALLMFGFFAANYWNGTSTAQAEVLRSLNATPKLRTYALTMVHQLPLWGQREIDATLYLDDRDRFVVQHPGWAGLGPIWIGGSPEQRWIVPFRGPAIIGGESIVGRWLAKKDMPSPYLHMTTILRRMSRAYDLQMLPSVSLPAVDGNGSILCRHIRGTIRLENKELPTTIELWADVETGIAQKLEISWQRKEQQRGPLRWKLQLIENKALPDNWFEPEGHARSNVLVTPVQSEVDLQILE